MFGTRYVTQVNAAAGDFVHTGYSPRVRLRPVPDIFGAFGVGTAMAYYRLYFMDRRTGHIDRFEEFDAAGDAAAIERAERHSAAAPIELWSGAKKIFRLEATAQIAPGARAATAARWQLTA
jgi:hypothetical protein